MLESIISPGTAERNPWDMVILGVIISSVAIWVGHYLADLLGVDTGMLSLAICVMALAPLMHRVIDREEEQEECASHDSPIGFVLRHVGIISMYSFLFVGMMASFAFWYVALPYDSNGPSAGDTFCLQESAVTGVQKKIITGKAYDTELVVSKPAVVIGESEENEGYGGSPLSAEDLAELELVKAHCNPQTTADAQTCLSAWRNRFSRLYDNNMRVMLFAFFASFLFGAGALWILTWNASVIGVFIGSKIKQDLIVGVMTPFSISLWAIPEILAYLVAAFAGGIISVAVAKHHFRSEGFWMAVFDGILFFLIAAFLVFIGAYLEQFFVPVPCPIS